MPNLSRLSNVVLANMARIDGLALSNIDKYSQVDISSSSTPTSGYTANSSVSFDGVNDYAETTLNCPSAQGTVSLWFKFGTTVGTSVLFNWHNYDTSGNFNEYIDIRLQNISGNPAARNIVFGYRGNGVSHWSEMKATTSDHGSGFSRWKYTYLDVTGFSSHERFTYNANRLTQTGSHPYSPAEGAEHGWHHIVMTWNVNETYVGKDSQAYTNSNGKFRPTQSDDGTTTTHTGVVKIYMDGVLRNFGGSAFPGHNYQKTPNGMSQMTSTVNKLRVGGRGNNANYTEAHMGNVAVWKTDLDASSVAAIYNYGDYAVNSGNYQSSGDLTGFWKFGEGSGTTIADVSTNSNNLTLYNSPSWSTDTP